MGVGILAGLGSWAAPGLLLWIGYIMYRLTVVRSTRTNPTGSPLALLAGTTFALELLGPGHFGYATLFAAAALCLSELGKRSFQFTSPFLRYAAVLFLSYAILDILIFPGNRTLGHVLTMALSALLSVIVSYLSFTSNNRGYENI